MIELLSKVGYRPRFCVWELTLACNLRCLHCGSFAGDERKKELSLEESLSIARQLVELGCEKVTLGGGEPTLNPHWHEIGRCLTDGGARVNIISNGWRWGDQELERTRHAGLTNVAFSLDGFAQAHDRQRRKGSFDRVIDALERTHQAGIPTSVITTINALNKDTLPAFRDFLGEHHVSSWQLQIGIPSGTMSHHRDELVIAPEDLLALVPVIAELREDQVKCPKLYPSDNIGYFGRFEKALRDQGSSISFWLGCRAGMQVIGIESDGAIKGCLSLPSQRHGKDIFLEGNLRDRTLGEIWRDPDAFSFNRNFREDQLAGFCGACRFADICRGGCAWTAYSHTHNRFDNPYCFYRQAVTHQRWDLLDEEPTQRELDWVADSGAQAGE